MSVESHSSKLSNLMRRYWEHPIYSQLLSIAGKVHLGVYFVYKINLGLATGIWGKWGQICGTEPFIYGVCANSR